MAPIRAITGLPKAPGLRFHFDIYAILEAPQEIYFGHETIPGVNLVETVRIRTPAGEELEKCYLAPSKRRGVERRMLIWAPTASGWLLGDVLGCGIPHTCGRADCPICQIFGALIPNAMRVERLDGTTEDRDPVAVFSRVFHGGGVAIQPLGPMRKQRAMHPSIMRKPPQADPTPMPFEREYHEPALLYPIANHGLSMTEEEFQAMAYAFLNALACLGAGTPKGVRIYEGPLAQESEPLLVVDQYWVPQGRRPVLSPALADGAEALAQFRRAARTVGGQEVDGPVVSTPHFTRWLGEAALLRLQEAAAGFAERVLARR